MENQKNMPILHFGATVSHGNCGRLGLYIENISENIATEVYISKIKILTCLFFNIIKTHCTAFPQYCTQSQTFDSC